MMAEGAAFRSFKDTVRVFLFNSLSIAVKFDNSELLFDKLYFLYVVLHQMLHLTFRIYGSVVFTNISPLDLLDTARAALTYRKHDGELRIFFSI